MSKEVTGKREQVLEMLKEGTFTREQIAEKLDMSVASVSSQFTYLRWMGNFITYDENKVVKLATEEEYNAWNAVREANKKTGSSTSKKPAAEQYASLVKTIENQEKQLDTWSLKHLKIEDDLKEMPDDEELLEMYEEAGANLILLKIKLKRNKVKLDAMPVPKDADIVEDMELDDGTDDGADDDGAEDDDLL